MAQAMVRGRGEGGRERGREGEREGGREGGREEGREGGGRERRGKGRRKGGREEGRGGGREVGGKEGGEGERDFKFLVSPPSDNVHFQQTAQLVQVLTLLDIQFRLQVTIT